MHRTFVRVTDADGYQVDEFTVNLSEFPTQGAVVTLLDGRSFEVWHPILKATPSPVDPQFSDKLSLPSLLVTPLDTPITKLPQVVEVSGGQHTPPVCHTVTPPGSLPRQLYMARPHVAGDGMDITLEGGPTGHHVIGGPNGRLFLEQQTLNTDTDDPQRPRFRFR